jgi:hypothetical protein
MPANPEALAASAPLLWQRWSDTFSAGAGPKPSSLIALALNHSVLSKEFERHRGFLGEFVSQKCASQPEALFGSTPGSFWAKHHADPNFVHPTLKNPFKNLP